MRALTGTLEARGVELAWRESGEGPAVLLVHETGTGAASWRAVEEAIGGRARAIAYDRRGWGASSAPDEYRRTTVEEQSEDAAALIEETGAVPAVLCGAGLGAVAALDLMLRRPELCAGALLIEPPLLGLVPAATAALSGDGSAIERAVAEGGVPAAVDLYRKGSLTALGPGAERLPASLLEPAGERPGSLFAELGAAAGWNMPLARLAGAEWPSLVVAAGSTPPLLRMAAESLASHLARSELRELDSGAAPPHLGAAPAIAALALDLAGGP